MSLKAVYESTLYESCESSSTTVTVSELSIDDIILTSDKSILSYADGEYATLTAQLQNEGSNVAAANVSVDFNIYDWDDNLLDTIVGTTNASGVASVSYHAQHSGDIYIRANVTNVFSNNIQIEDITYYDSANTNAKISNYTNQFVLSGTNAVTTLSYNSNDYKLSGSGNWYAGIPILNSISQKELLLEMDCFTNINNWRNGVGFYISDSNNYNLIYHMEGDNKFRTDGNINSDSCTFYSNVIGCNIRGLWCKLKVILDLESKDADIIITDNNSNVLLNTSYPFTNTNFDDSNGIKIGLMHITETGTTNSVLYIKNIKVKVL